MAGLSEWILSACIIPAQVVGLSSIVLARLTLHGALQALVQRIFCVALIAIGFATMLAAAVGSNYWQGLAITLSIMTLGAILDFRHQGIAHATR